MYVVDSDMKLNNTRKQIVKFPLQQLLSWRAAILLYTYKRNKTVPEIEAKTCR